MPEPFATIAHREPPHLSMTIEALTGENLELRRQVASLEETIAWQLEIARANLDVSHAQHVRIQKQRKQYLDLLEEFRLYRERHAPRTTRQQEAA